MAAKDKSPKRSEAEQRKMDVARKKFQKSHKPASGRIDSYSDELGQAILTGGRGFGVQSRTGFTKGRTKFQGGTELERDAMNSPLRAKTPVKTDSSFIRKSTVKKSIKKIEKKPKK